MPYIGLPSFLQIMNRPFEICLREVSMPYIGLPSFLLRKE